MNKSLRLEDLEVYKIAREIGKSFGIRKPKPGTLFLMKNLFCSMKNLIFISD